MTASVAIIARSAAHANALQLWAIPLLDSGKQATVLILDDYDEFETRLRKLNGFIDGLVSDNADTLGGHLTLLVDSLNAGQLAITRGADSIDQSIAASILCYPEVRWLFGSVENMHSAEDSPCFPIEFHELEALPNVSRAPLFDPTGIREWIRERTNLQLKRSAGNQKAPFEVPRRKEMAVVIEDERDFAFLHAYAAYRFGFRTDVVTSWRQMLERFHVHSPQNAADRAAAQEADQDEQSIVELTEKERHPYRLILEDMRLQFTDKPANKHLSKLRERCKECNRLAHKNDYSQFRFMISTGQESKPWSFWRRVETSAEYDPDADAPASLWADNEKWLQTKSEQVDKLGRRGHGKLLAKPIGGPLGLWQETKLFKHLPNGHADGFASTPPKQKEDSYDGHGAPGKLAFVASLLIARARRVASGTDTTCGFILSAVLANDAFELLGGKTPAMSLDALRIKITSEVRAECSFIGAGFHSDLKYRIKDIEKFVESACNWYHEKEREQVGPTWAKLLKAAGGRHKEQKREWREWDAKAAIYNELVKIYRDAGQVEEEDHCLREFRWYNRLLMRPRGLHFSNLFAWPMHGVLWYAELLLGGLGRIVLAFVLWIILLGTMNYILTGISDPSVYVAKQLNWMVGGGAYDMDMKLIDNGLTGPQATRDDTVFAVLSIASNVIGVFHFGILMSYLYSLISRK